MKMMQKSLLDDPGKGFMIGELLKIGALEGRCL